MATPARSIGTGSISFGLVAIPIKMYPATQPSAGVSFHLLDKETKERVKQQYIRPSDGKIVPRAEMVKGYELADDQYVVFTPEELKALEEKATQSIDITEFVPLSAIDPVYFDKPYYLGPERGGEKAYRLLTEVMRETGRSALARYAARGKQYLVLLRPIEDRIVMQQLLYADEVRSSKEIPVPDVVVKDMELKLAHQIVDQITSETFEPTKYKDDVRERVMADVQRKIDGQEIAAQEPEETPAQIIDLMEALKASLGARGGKAASSAGGADKARGAERKPARAAVGDEAEEGDAEKPAKKVVHASARTRRR